jgi:hypothetical protein
MGFAVDEVALGNVFLQVFPLRLVTYSAYSFSVTLAVDSVVNTQ